MLASTLFTHKVVMTSNTETRTCEAAMVSFAYGPEFKLELWSELTGEKDTAPRIRVREGVIEIKKSRVTKKSKVTNTLGLVVSRHGDSTFHLTLPPLTGPLVSIVHDGSRMLVSMRCEFAKAKARFHTDGSNSCLLTEFEGTGKLIVSRLLDLEHACMDLLTQQLSIQDLSLIIMLYVHDTYEIP